MRKSQVSESSKPTQSSSSADAQCWFGPWSQFFGYYHEEALTCFQKSAGARSELCDGLLGWRLRTGPNYNYPWELQDPVGEATALARAHDADRAALALSDRVRPLRVHV